MKAGLENVNENRKTMTKKEREISEAIVRAMVKQNSMTVGMQTTRTVAQHLGMKAPELYKLLRKEGVLTKVLKSFDHVGHVIYAQPPSDASPLYILSPPIRG